VNTALPEDIAEFAAVVAKRLTRFGGPQAALRAETEEPIRQDARAALADLGAFDLDARSASEDLLAAAVLCQAAGAAALPYPLVEELLAIDGARLALVNPEAARIDHGDLPGDWIAADLDGMLYRPQPSSRTSAKLGPFLVSAILSEPDGTVPPADVDLHLVLGSWRILGALQQSLEITRQHVLARMQFDKPLAEFQAVRFTIADASVAVRGLYELAKYTIFRAESAPAQVRSTDAVILRLKAADTARQVFRTAHQLLGALGFCDESDISVLDRHTQPLIRLPVSTAVLALRLMPGVRAGQLETLFSEPFTEPAAESVSEPAATESA
jgi:acyl-CoA dehydrogenase-like protein